MAEQRKKVVLAYFGGLDNSRLLLSGFLKNINMDVVTVTNYVLRQKVQNGLTQENIICISKKVFTNVPVAVMNYLRATKNLNHSADGQVLTARSEMVTVLRK